MVKKQQKYKYHNNIVSISLLSSNYNLRNQNLKNNISFKLSSRVLARYIQGKTVLYTFVILKLKIL